MPANYNPAVYNLIMVQVTDPVTVQSPFPDNVNVKVTQTLETIGVFTARVCDVHKVNYQPQAQLGKLTTVKDSMTGVLSFRP